MNALEWFAVVGAVAAVIQLILYAVGCVRFCLPVSASKPYLLNKSFSSDAISSYRLTPTRHLAGVLRIEQQHEHGQSNKDHGLDQSVRTGLLQKIEPISFSFL